jgi:hypothetical protein
MIEGVVARVRLATVATVVAAGSITVYAAARMIFASEVRLVSNERTMTADDVFAIAMDWLRQHYDRYIFFAERDVVWTIQTKVIDMIAQHELPLKVFNDHRVQMRGRRVYCDLIITSGEHVQLGVEFKYEPSHARGDRDIPARKFPVCFWGDDGVGSDIAKAREFVGSGFMPLAHAILIDEGRYWRRLREEPHNGANWVDWGDAVNDVSPSLHWFTARIEP